MNKTVNINLAGIFFHIDEDAYLKLQHYLEAIKHSFSESQGQSEILADIENRIAELFNERIKNNKHVITSTEVDTIIAIMGQPEDYAVNEDIFDDEPQPKTKNTKSQYQSNFSKKGLFRDPDNRYISGVSAGLAQYFGVSAIWIRVVWILLLSGAGTGLFIYIALWILIPKATSTADKLSMSGKPINITNIEEKVKEGFSNVKDSLDEAADKVKNANYTTIKTISTSFFDALSQIFMILFKSVKKIIGVLLVFMGAVSIIALFIGLFSIGISSLFYPEWINNSDVIRSSINTPIWLISLLLFFLIVIPLLFMLLLGLKILKYSISSIGRVARFTLFGLWLIVFSAIAVITIKELAEHTTKASVVEQSALKLKLNKPVSIKMLNHDFYQDMPHNNVQINTLRFENDDRQVFSTDVSLIIETSEDSQAHINIEKRANGRNYNLAKQTAKNIEYQYTTKNNEILLNDYLLTDVGDKLRNQKVNVILFLPKNTIFKLDTYASYFVNQFYPLNRNIVTHTNVIHSYKVVDNRTIKCLTCDVKSKS